MTRTNSNPAQIERYTRRNEMRSIETTTKAPICTKNITEEQHMSLKYIKLHQKSQRTMMWWFVKIGLEVTRCIHVCVHNDGSSKNIRRFRKFRD